MTKYQLAKLIALSGGEIGARKRIQKMVYLLQSAKLDFDADFRLHHFGPYSAEVANLLNQMVREGILREKAYSQGTGTQYDYSLSEGASENLKQWEATTKGRKAAEDFDPYKEQILGLSKRNLRELEFASTVAFFFQRNASLPSAVEQTCQFKNVSDSDATFVNARNLACSVLECDRES